MRLMLEIQRGFRVSGRLAGLAWGLLVISLLQFSGAAPLHARDAGVSGNDKNERSFVLANTEFTLLHEIAHVLIWELKPPVFGREEDAADTIAMMAQMMLPEREGEAGVIEKLQAVADGWKLEWQLVQEDALENAYWDLHSLEIQRYYNIACLVYGADPENRGAIVKAAALPIDRAEWCQEEYALASNAMDWLLSKLSVPASTRDLNRRRGKVFINYDDNLSLEGEKLDKWLKESGITERLAEAVGRRFDMPRDITISFEGCPFSNAAWDAKTAKITFCHSLLNRFLYLARELKKEAAETADSTIWRATSDGAVQNNPMSPGKRSRR